MQKTIFAEYRDSDWQDMKEHIRDQYRGILFFVEEQDSGVNLEIVKAKMKTMPKTPFDTERTLADLKQIGFVRYDEEKRLFFITVKGKNECRLTRKKIEELRFGEETCPA